MKNPIVLNTCDGRARFRAGARAAEIPPPFRMGTVLPSADIPAESIPAHGRPFSLVPLVWDGETEPCLVNRHKLVPAGFTPGARVFRIAPPRLYGRLPRHTDSVRLLTRKSRLMPDHVVVIWDNGRRTIEARSNLTTLHPLQHATPQP